jgi:hypothetical protein
MALLGMETPGSPDLSFLQLQVPPLEPPRPLP